jgi:hypothetical protein
MSSVARGSLAGLLALLLFAGLLLPCTGCLGTKGGGSAAPTLPRTMTPAVPAQIPPSPALTTTIPDLSAPPPKASPFPTSSVDPLVGTWYAPSPDDLTFEFFADGTFTERSPAFRTYQGNWAISEEQEAGFYDATILDRWGYRKEVHMLLASGTLSIKSMGTLHRIG